MSSLKRIVGWSGVASVVLIGVALFGGTPPAIDDSGRSVLSYAADHRTFLLVYFFGLGIAICFTLVFFAGLRRIVADPERPELDVWGSVMFGSAVAVFTLGLAGQACTVALAFRADAAPSAESARTLWDLFVVLMGASNLVTVLLGVAAALAIRLSRLLPNWLAAGAVVVAAAHLAAAASWARSGALSQSGVFTTLAPALYITWVVAVSVVLLRNADQHD